MVTSEVAIKRIDEDGGNDFKNRRRFTIALDGISTCLLSWGARGV